MTFRLVEDKKVIAQSWGLKPFIFLTLEIGL